jgi:SAM-dependent methyltransferase
MRATLEPRYLASDEPWRQSGFAGPEARWTALRRPIAECIDRPGAFLDIGCANGYLIECVQRWAPVPLACWGIDLSPRLIERARQRLPALAAQLLVANGFDWEPPQRFEFVRTELVYVPAGCERAYLLRLLRRVVAPGGALLVANYVEGRNDAADTVIAGSCARPDILAHLRSIGFATREFHDGYDPIKQRRTRVAVLRA